MACCVDVKSFRDRRGMSERPALQESAVVQGSLQACKVACCECAVLTAHTGSCMMLREAAGCRLSATNRHQAICACKRVGMLQKYSPPC